MPHALIERARSYPYGANRAEIATFTGGKETGIEAVFAPRLFSARAAARDATALLCRATVASPVAFTDFRNWNEPMARMKVGEREERSFLPCFSPRPATYAYVPYVSYLSYRKKVAIA